MKHLVISLVCTVAVAAYSFYSANFIDTFYKDMNAEIVQIEINDYSPESIEHLSAKFYDKKNMLLLISNKEHIDELEEYITALKVAVDNDNPLYIQLNTEMIIDVTEYIKMYACGIY